MAGPLASQPPIHVPSSTATCVFGLLPERANLQSVLFVFFLFFSFFDFLCSCLTEANLQKQSSARNISPLSVRHKYCSGSIRGSIRSSPRYSVLIGETFWEPILRLCTSPIGGLDCFNVALALGLALHEANCGAGHRSRNPYHHCLVCAVVSACLHLSICLGGSEIFRQRTLVFWFDTRFFFPLLPFFEPMEGKKKIQFYFFCCWFGMFIHADPLPCKLE